MSGKRLGGPEESSGTGERNLVSAVTAACLGMLPVSYAAATSTGGGGYSSQQLDEKTARVKFASPQTLDTELVSKLALFRCAQLACERGYERFAVLGDSAIAMARQEDVYAEAVYTIHMLGQGAGDESREVSRRVFQTRELMAELAPLVERSQRRE